MFIDVSQKQSFVFKHNRLRDILKQSFIVKCITEEVNDPGPVSISLSEHLKKHFPERHQFEYSGGGNSIIRFQDGERAKTFIRGYSSVVLEAYPDLELYLSLVDEADPQDAGRISEGRMREADIRTLLHEKADKWKDGRQSRFRRWSYGVEQIDEAGQPRKADMKKAETADRSSKDYLHERMKAQLQDTTVRLTEKLQDYKKEDSGKSYIGVIVIDGNQMGDMVKRLPSFADVRNFSRFVESIYFQAVVETLRQLPPVEICITPVVMAGDDICMIAEAEHAVTAAADIVQRIQTLSRERMQDIAGMQDILPKNGLTVCAGVAIARYSYPFFEMVDHAERLCRHAKSSVYHIPDEEGRAAGASFIDWEVIQEQVRASQPYANYVRHRNDWEAFHIKPLRIDQSEPLQHGLYSYSGVIRLIGHIRDRRISHSFLEKVKKHMYSGREQYELLFETTQTEHSAALSDIVRELYGNHCEKCDHTIVTTSYAENRTYTYVLNDVLDALPFIGSKGVTFRAERP